MATSSMRSTRKRLTPEEERKRDEQDEMVTAAFALSHLMFLGNLARADKPQNQPTKKSKIVKKDDSEETLQLLLRWTNDTPTIPSQEIIRVLGRCSELIRKQLTESDVKEGQSRLMLGKEQVEKKFMPLLQESEIPLVKEGIRVSVYGPDGKVQGMTFKMWNEKTPVLMSGWNDFVKRYELKMHCDFLTASMFRHKETGEICFAIDSTKLPIERMLSRRISKIAFKV